LADEFRIRVVNGSICAIWLTLVKDIERIFELIDGRKLSSTPAPLPVTRPNLPRFLR